MFAIRSNRLFFLLIALWLSIAASIRPLSIPDEGRYADITRWMVESGDWLTPRIDSIPFFHKPPLLHWIGGGLLELFGIHIWVMRLAPVIAAMVMLIGMFWFVRRHSRAPHQETLARSSVLVMASSLLFYGSSQYINHDLMVAAWISLTVFAIADFTLTNAKSSRYLGYFAAACALLSKGLIGVLIPGMILLPWLIVAGHWRRIPAILHPAGIILFVALITPWLYLVDQKYPGFAHYFFIEQQFDRFSSGQFNNKQPWPFYLVCLLVSFLPWLLSIGKNYRWKSVGQLLNPTIFPLLTWWAISVTVFFSLPPSKLAGYILPATPPLAIYLACVLHALLPTRTSGVRLMRDYASVVFVALIALASLALPFIPRAAIELSPQESRELVILAVVLLAALTGIVVLYRKSRITPFQVTLMAAILLCTSVSFLVKWLDHKSNADQMAFAQDLTPQMSLVFYHNYYYDIPFMLNRKQPIYWVEDWATVAGDNGAAQIKDGLRFEPDKQYLLWTDQDLAQRIAGHESLMILVPSNLSVPALGSLAPVRVEKNFRVYIVGQPITTTVFPAKP